MMLTEADCRIAELSRRQHQIFTYAQALAAGLSPDQIQHRLDRGVWIRLASGVYAPAGAVVETRGRVHGLALSVPGSVASHQAAGEIHDYPYLPHGIVVVSRHQVRPNRTALGRIRRVCDFRPGDHTVVDGIPVTTRLRTSADLAVVLRPERYERMIDELLVRRAFTTDELAALASRWCRRGRKGSALLWRTVDARGSGYVAPESVLEAKGLALLEAGGLPPPVRQIPLPWRTELPGRLDCGYPPYQVLIEWDSRKHHLIEAQFELDRRRDADAIAHGWAPLRYTWKMIDRDPDWIVDTTWKTLRGRGFPNAPVLPLAA